MIPEAAIEAAMSAIQHLPTVENQSRERTVRAILEAALPHILAPVLTLADEMDTVHGSIRGHVTTYQLRQALGVSDA